MTSVDTTGPSTHLTDYVIRVPASAWQPIEKVHFNEHGGSTGDALRAGVGGYIEALPLLEGNVLEEFLSELHEDDKPAIPFELDAFGNEEGRYAENNPIANARAAILLGWTHANQHECIVGDIVIATVDREGDTHGVPTGLFEWLLTLQVGNRMVPGL